MGAPDLASETGECTTSGLAVIRPELRSGLGKHPGGSQLPATHRRQTSLWHFQDRSTRTLKGLASTGRLREARKRTVSTPFSAQSHQKGQILPQRAGFSGVCFTVWILVHASILSDKCLILHLLSIPPTGNASSEGGILGGRGGEVGAFIGFGSAAPRQAGTAGRRGGHPFGAGLT